MVHKSPGKSDRVGVSLTQFFGKSPNDSAAEAWFEERRWGESRCAPIAGHLA